MYGLQVKEIPKVGFFGKHLGSGNEAAAFTKINNLIASVPISQIHPEHISQILSEYEVTLWSTPQAFKDLYLKVVQFFLADRYLSEEEFNELKRLQQLLSISPGDAMQIEFSLKDYFYSQAVIAVLQDSHLSVEEGQYLDQLANALQLPYDRALEIRAYYSQQLFQHAVDHAVADQRLSPEEEAYLNNLANNLGVNVQFSNPQTQAAYNRFRVLWQLSIGNLPALNVPVMLQKGEICSLYLNYCQRSEMKTVTVKTERLGTTRSYKTWTGACKTTSSFRTYKQTQDVWQLQDSGTLFCTNKRLLFDGAKQSVSIPNDKIINFTVYSDGLLIERDTGNDTLFEYSADAEVVQATLEGLFR